jgi:hypothetical protein
MRRARLSAPKLDQHWGTAKAKAMAADGVALGACEGDAPSAALTTSTCANFQRPHSIRFHPARWRCQALAWSWCIGWPAVSSLHAACNA